MLNEQHLFNEINKRSSKSTVEKLKKSTVLIMGLGGLGSNVATMLVRSSIGKLILIDFDKVEASNLNRQAYTVQDIGIEKTLALKNHLIEINPFVKIETKNIRVEENNIDDIIKDYKYIIEAFDNAKYKALLANIILEKYPEKYLVSASGMAGIGNSNTIETIKIRDNFYLCGDRVSDYEECDGIMSPRVMLCASHEANCMIDIISKVEK